MLRRDIALELVDLRALATDDDARTRRVDDDLQTIGGALDIDVRNAGAGKALLQIALQLQIFKQELAKLLLRKPVRMPVLVVAEAKTVWMNFLTHNLLQFFVSESESRISNLRSSIRLSLRSVFFFRLQRGLPSFARLLSRFVFFGAASASALRCAAAALSRVFAAALLSAQLLRRHASLSCYAGLPDRLCFPASPGSIARKQNRHVTKVSLLAIRSTLRRGSHTATILGWSTIDERRLHPKIVRIDRDVCLLSRFVRVRDRRPHALLDAAARRACSNNAGSPTPG